MRYQVVVGVRDIVLKYADRTAQLADHPHWRYVLTDFLTEIGRSGPDIDTSSEAMYDYLQAYWEDDGTIQEQPPDIGGLLFMASWCSEILARIVQQWDRLFIELPKGGFCHDVSVEGWVGLDLLIEFYFNIPAYRVAGVPDF